MGIQNRKNNTVAENEEKLNQIFKVTPKNYFCSKRRQLQKGFRDLVQQI